MDLARMAGLVLDPWQELVLRESLGERANGKWAAFEVGLVVPRQNGKNSILEARELAGLFLLGERLIIHAAHQFDTSKEHFRRLVDLIEGTPEFSRRVKSRGIKQSHGEEGIELANGQRIRFRTRTKGGGRGFTGDLVVFDEAMDFPESAHGAILPTLAARSVAGNPQVWYAASAVDSWNQENGRVLSKLRERGHEGTDNSLAYFEWSCEGSDPDTADDLATDPEAWAQANPGLGHRIHPEHVAREQRSMDPRTFAVERLGIGAWPRPEGEEEQVISAEMVSATADPQSKVLDPVCFAFDVTPDRRSSSIAVSGKRKDGKRHIEVIARRGGTGWVAPAMAELVTEWECEDILCDERSPAAALLNEFTQLGIDVKAVNAKEMVQACGSIYDAFDQGTVRHLETPELLTALRGAAKRNLIDAWAWSRKSSAVDISPLVACTLAHWGSAANEAAERPVPLVAYV